MPRTIALKKMSNWYPFFSDLSAYCAPGRVSHPIEAIRNIGWISNSTNFTKSIKHPAEFLQKLKSLVQDRDLLVNKIRGYAPCELCGYSRYEDSTGLVLGNAELLLKGSAFLFCSPTLIIHYVEAHHYLPPSEFIDCVLSFNKDSEYRAEEIFKREVSLSSLK